MAESLIINVVKSTDYKSLTISDATDWTAITGTIDSLTTITLNFYTSSTELSDYTYSLTSLEVDEYVANEKITLTFLNILGREYPLDNWYYVQMSANSGDYISNYSDFLSDIYITNKVYENVNDLYTPEPYKKTIEPLAMQVIFLEGMKYLGLSTLTDRDIKGKKRLNILNRLNP